MVGNTPIDRALVDLGAGVNLLPYSVYKQLDVGVLKPTKVMIQLADRSVKIPRGELEDVLIKVNEFVFPVDFIVLDTAPVSNLKRQTPMILGRPFLATSNAMINCRTGSMKLTFGNMTLDLNIFNQGKQPNDPQEEYVGVNAVQEVPSEQDTEEAFLIELAFQEECEKAEAELELLRNSMEEDLMAADSPQIFEDICNEEIRLFEDEQGWTESQPLEKGRWTVYAGPPIFDEEPSDPVESGWYDPFLEPTKENVSVDKESPGRELWLNSLDVDNDQISHTYVDPFDYNSGSFEHGEWIFDHERKFFGNKDPRSNDIQRDQGVEFGETVDMEITDNVVEDDDIKENQFGWENEECCTAEKVRWKKKKNARMRVPGYERRSGEVGCFWSNNVLINSLRRTHFQSGKRSRGRNRPSLI
jgi:hypothetical protein